MASPVPIASDSAVAAPVDAEILVIVAHPELEQSRANQRLLAAARALQQRSPAGRLAVRDLYALYPDYLIDVGVEQAALASAKLVVWTQP
ncbi:MAG TPA: NAD(P)H-dependent oxidoreductase, partial [Caldimonas sp.]